MFRCNLHFWQNDQGLSHATAVTQGWNGHQIKVSTELWRRKFPHHFSGIRTHKLFIMSPVLYQQAIRAPWQWYTYCFIFSHIPDLIVLCKFRWLSMKNVSLCNDQCLVIILHGKTVVIFLDPIKCDNHKCQTLHHGTVD